MSLVLANISKKYDGRPVLTDINLDCRKGEIIGLVGRNGVGKSTLLKIIAGVITDFQGRLSKGGHVGYLSERNPMYPQMYVSEYLHWLNRLNRTTTIAEEQLSTLVSQLGLKEVGGQKINTLSKGYRQRVGLAAALLSNPEILILDEPINGLDPIQIEDYRNLIKSYAHDKIVILSSHLMQEIEAICDRVISLKGGSISSDHYLQKRTNSNKQCIYLYLDRPIDMVAMEAIFEIENISRVKDDNTYEVTSREDTDIRPIVFDYVVSQGSRILEMRNKVNRPSELFKPSL